MGSKDRQSSNILRVYKVGIDSLSTSVVRTKNLVFYIRVASIDDSFFSSSIKVFRHYDIDTTNII